MVFLGDISIPFGITPTISHVPWSSDQLVMANMEGDVVREGEVSKKERAVFNGSEALRFLSDFGVSVVSLANNHLLDVHDAPKKSINRLSRTGVKSVGAGRSLDAAREPAIVKEGRSQVNLLAFGWKVIGCRTATKSRPGVNLLTARNVLESIRQIKSRGLDGRLVLYMHWNYELELYPQPMHRQLACRAIDAGADAVIGTHSHRVQGIEVYRGSPIVHGLGNWMFAQGEYFGATLTYPNCASTELAFEWDLEQGSMTCHWFTYDSQNHTLSYQNSEPVAHSERVHELTPYAGMGHEQYVSFFREHRCKRKLLPIYSSCDQPVRNQLRDYWVAFRGAAIRTLMRIGLKSGQRSS